MKDDLGNTDSHEKSTTFMSKLVMVGIDIELIWKSVSDDIYEYLGKLFLIKKTALLITQ